MNLHILLQNSFMGTQMKKSENYSYARSGFAITFLSGIQRMNAYTLPISAVISCVTENVAWNTAIFAYNGLASGKSIGISV